MTNDDEAEARSAGDADVVELELRRNQQSVPHARHFVEDVLRQWELPELVDSAAVVCSELTTNALLHGAPPVRLMVRRRTNGIRIEVHDGRRADPVRARSGGLSTQGRGMAMVEMLSADWGVDATDAGKSVWAEVGDQPEPEGTVSVEELEAMWGLDDVLDERATDAPAPTDDAAMPTDADAEVPGRAPSADPVAELASLVTGGGSARGTPELRARVMVDHMYQFVGLLNADGVLIEANLTALVAGGLQPGDVIGRHFWDCAWWQVSPRTVREVRDAVRAARAGQEVRYDVDVWAGAAGSQLVTIDFSCRPLVASDGSVPFLVVEGRDITEKKRAEVELAAAVEQLEVANRRLTELDTLRREFIANVSHELRTPLTIILSAAERLLDDAAATSAAREVHRIRDAGAVLLKRVNDLLSAAALEQQREIRRQDADLAAMARRVAAQYEGLIGDRHQHLLVQADGRCVVSVDTDLMESLLSNLIGNAVKFTPDGGAIRVSVQRWGERALLEVADSGPGIPAEMRSAVLEPFRQVEGSATRRHEGTGLGLAIAAQVVARHGGEIAVAEAPEGGALVSVTLVSSADDIPAAEPADAVTRAVRADVDALRAELKRPAEAADHPRPSSGRRRVLVAEDNVDLADYLVELLETQYDVTLARDGAQAYEVAARIIPDVIITDIMMPGLSGVELLERTRSHPRLTSVPVVLLTARADARDRVDALRSGAADYIVKPFDPAELLARLQNLLRE